MSIFSSAMNRFNSISISADLYCACKAIVDAMEAGTSVDSRDIDLLEKTIQRIPNDTSD